MTFSCLKPNCCNRELLLDVQDFHNYDVPQIISKGRPWDTPDVCSPARPLWVSSESFALSITVAQGTG